MTDQDQKAIDAIWKTDLETANEKLVLYHLASKHELGDRYASTWKNIDRFLDDFKPHWCPYKNLKDVTKISDIKLQRTIDALTKKGYIEIQDSLDPSLAGVPSASSYAITPKIFKNFRMAQEKQSKQA